MSLRRLLYNTLTSICMDTHTPVFPHRMITYIIYIHMKGKKKISFQISLSSLNFLIEVFSYFLICTPSHEGELLPCLLNFVKGSLLGKSYVICRNLLLGSWRRPTKDHHSRIQSGGVFIIWRVKLPACWECPSNTKAKMATSRDACRIF